MSYVTGRGGAVTADEPPGRAPMSRRRTIHRTPRPMALAAGLLVAAAPLAVAGTAGAQGPNVKIGPHQVFGGEINGSDGITSTPTIQMACFGPITPGETGHPLPNQTIGVFQP